MSMRGVWRKKTRRLRRSKRPRRCLRGWAFRRWSLDVRQSLAAVRHRTVRDQMIAVAAPPLLLRFAAHRLPPRVQRLLLTTLQIIKRLIFISRNQVPHNSKNECRAEPIPRRWQRSKKKIVISPFKWLFVVWAAAWGKPHLNRIGKKLGSSRQVLKKTRVSPFRAVRGVSRGGDVQPKCKIKKEADNLNGGCSLTCHVWDGTERRKIVSLAASQLAGHFLLVGSLPPAADECVTTLRNGHQPRGG